MSYVPRAHAQSDPEREADSLYAGYDEYGALDAYRVALRDGDSFDLLLKAGYTALLVGDQVEASKEDYFSEAVRYAERLHRKYPERAESWTLLAATTGKMAVFHGPRAKAHAARGVYTLVTEALTIDSTYVYAHILAGILAREVSQLGWLKRLAASTVLGGLPPGSITEAKSHFEQAVRLDPDYIIARWELAKTCLAMDLQDEAMVHLRYIRRLDADTSQEDRLKRKAARYESDLAGKLYGSDGR
jgi:tetratricopeptide (TPR) repeat protein